MRLSITLLAVPAVFSGVAKAAGYDTYPSVAHTATINGFADPIYSSLPECAQGCVDQDTGVTPCPYWDTGCLCVISSFGDLVAACVAESCSGSDVAVATSLATSICSSAGVNDPYWYIASSLQGSLSAAAEAAPTSSTEATSTTEAGSTRNAAPASSADATTATATSEPESTNASSAPGESAAASSSAASSAAASSAAPSATTVASSSEESSSTETPQSSTVISSSDSSAVSETSAASSAATESPASSSAAVSSSATVEQANNAGLNTRNQILVTGGVAAAIAMLY